MTHRESLMDLLSDLVTIIERYQEETRQNFFAMNKRIEVLETARTVTLISRMKTWTASLISAGRLLNAIYRIYLAVSLLTPPLIPIWRLIRSYFQG